MESKKQNSNRGYVINIINTYVSTSTVANLTYFNMTPTNTTDMEDAYLNLTIPRDAGTGAKTDTITFTAVETAP